MDASSLREEDKRMIKGIMLPAASTIKTICDTHCVIRSDLYIPFHLQFKIMHCLYFFYEQESLIIRQVQIRQVIDTNLLRLTYRYPPAALNLGTHTYQ